MTKLQLSMICIELDKSVVESLVFVSVSLLYSGGLYFMEHVAKLFLII